MRSRALIAHDADRLQEMAERVDAHLNQLLTTVPLSEIAAIETAIGNLVQESSRQLAAALDDAGVTDAKAARAGAYRYHHERSTGRLVPNPQVNP